MSGTSQVVYYTYHKKAEGIFIRFFNYIFLVLGFYEQFKNRLKITNQCTWFCYVKCIGQFLCIVVIHSLVRSFRTGGRYNLVALALKKMVYKAATRGEACF